MTQQEVSHQLSCAQAYFAGCLSNAQTGSAAAKRFLSWMDAIDEARKAVLAEEDDGK